MDILFTGKRKSIIAAIMALAGCILMICCPDIAVMSAKKGIALWASDVLPAMLPFFICVNFLTVTGITACLPSGVFPFVMSILSGYPMGAKIIGDMARSGAIDKTEVKRLISFCSTSGPVFIIGAVGASMLSSHKAGIVIALAHYGGAVCNWFVFTKIFKRKNTADTGLKSFYSGDLSGKFTEAIFISFRSLSVILAYIILFMLITDMIESAGVFAVIENPAVTAFARGLFEMTVGCSSVAGLDLFLNVKCIMISAIISWGGMSVIGQTMSMLSEAGISVFYVAVTKLLHSIFAGIIALFISCIML